jgi:hypothetical protein
MERLKHAIKKAGFDGGEEEKKMLKMLLQGPHSMR